MNYYQTLKKLHQHLKPSLYLETGIRNGDSLQLAFGNTKCIGIDPAYDMKFPHHHSALLAKETSDDFFSKEKYLRHFSHSKINFSFIDGMHLFEFALRDFINIEKYSSKNSVIAIHDCVPKSMKTATRDRETDFWTGDVWKIIKILEKYRPDLHIHILNAEPSGLALVTNLNPGSTVLKDNYSKIEKEFMTLAFSESKKIDVVDAENFNYSIFSPKHNKKIVKFQNLSNKLLNKPLALAVLLCYNDADILDDAIQYLHKNKHAIVVWDHGSDDNTSKVLDKYDHLFVERKFVPRSFNFYNLYPTMSQHLIDNYIDQYDWISWPDQDEILEGPDRKKDYYSYITDVFRSKYNWIQFNNFNYWFTEKDDQSIKSPIKRIKYYSIFPNCAPRIRSWRASVTNIREFNHNPLSGERYPHFFNIRHYPMRSAAQMKKRINKDRAGLKRGQKNVHYNNMQQTLKDKKIKSSDLLFDNGRDELCYEQNFNWDDIYFGK